MLIVNKKIIYVFTSIIQQSRSAMVILCLKASYLHTVGETRWWLLELSAKFLQTWLSTSSTGGEDVGEAVPKFAAGEQRSVSGPESADCVTQGKVQSSRVWAWYALSLDAPSVFQETAASATPGSMLAMQNLRFHPRLTDRNCILTWHPANSHIHWNVRSSGLQNW